MKHEEMRPKERVNLLEMPKYRFSIRLSIPRTVFYCFPTLELSSAPSINFINYFSPTLTNNRGRVAPVYFTVGEEMATLLI